MFAIVSVIVFQFSAIDVGDVNLHEHYVTWHAMRFFVLTRMLLIWKVVMAWSKRFPWPFILATTLLWLSFFLSLKGMSSRKQDRFFYRIDFLGYFYSLALNPQIFQEVHSFRTHILTDFTRDSSILSCPRELDALYL